ncbi:MAG: aminotransferase [Planctomycetaceae bacterium]|nr:MAG: aminotransferase [Planctomycetaceae bacterium]
MPVDESVWKQLSQRTREALKQLAWFGGEPALKAQDLQEPITSISVRKAIESALEDGSWRDYRSPWHRRLEETLRQLFQVEHVLLCSSGTAGVELALRGAGVEPADHVLMAAYDFKGNFLNVHAVGGLPVLLDVRMDDGQLDVAKLPGVPVENTKAIIVSHLHGGRVSVKAVKDWGARYGLAVIEDVCQAPLVKSEGSYLGTTGDIAVLSFGGSKLLTAGRGGALLIRNRLMYERIRRYFLRGNEAYPLSSIQAAMILPQLETLPQSHEQRAEAVVALWQHTLWCQTFRPWQLPRADYCPAYYKVACEYGGDLSLCLSRPVICALLQAEGVPVHPGYRALQRIHARRRYRLLGELPGSEHHDERVVVFHHTLFERLPPAALQIPQALMKIQMVQQQVQFTRDEWDQLVGKDLDPDKSLEL